MSIEAEFEEDTATIRVVPAHGRPVTFVVERRVVPVGKPGYYSRQRRANRYVVGLKGSTGDGFGWHAKYDSACRSALYRARRYERAYSVPRGVGAA